MVRFAPYAALLSAIAGTAAANPLPPNAVSPLPSDFVLAPLITPPAPPSSSPSFGQVATDSHVVRDSYIVRLEDHLACHEVDAHHAHVERIHAADLRVRSLKRGLADGDDSHLEGLVHKYHIGGKQNKHSSRKLRGYSGKFSESTLDAIRAMKGVKYVERDTLVYATDVEKGAPWGLARISHRNTLGFGTFNKYEFDGHGGEGVDAYVIDTGVNIKHIELEGRAKWGKTVPKGDTDNDANGHGSHVAGTIASAKYGVAKKAQIIAVKVLGSGGSGTMSDVVAGVAWAADKSYEKLKSKDAKHRGSVANMSLGGGKSPSLDDAVDAAVDDGLNFAVAAGNDNKDACNYSPAASKNAITVGASSIADERAYFSNFGKCVDVFAPGLNILSIWNSGNSSINSISGTSMASPHVAGLAAYFLSLYPTSFSPSEDDFTEEAYSQILYGSPSYVQQGAQFVFGKVKEWRYGKAVAPIPNKPLSPSTLKKAILRLASQDKLDKVGEGSPNLLIFNNFTSPKTIVDTIRQVSLE